MSIPHCPRRQQSMLPITLMARNSVTPEQEGHLLSHSGRRNPTKPLGRGSRTSHRVHAGAWARIPVFEGDDEEQQCHQHLSHRFWAMELLAVFSCPLQHPGQRKGRTMHLRSAAEVKLKKSFTAWGSTAAVPPVPSRTGAGSFLLFLRNITEVTVAKGLLTTCSLIFAWYRSILKVKPKN